MQSLQRTRIREPGISGEGGEVHTLTRREAELSELGQSPGAAAGPARLLA